jgi:hypothetical protein
MYPSMVQTTIPGPKGCSRTARSMPLQIRSAKASCMMSVVRDLFVCNRIQSIRRRVATRPEEPRTRFHSPPEPARPAAQSGGCSATGRRAEKMVEIRLRNSMTRRVERLEPIDPGNVRMYVCGPTVYDRAHLGNARPVVVFDVLYRLLRHVYGPEHVTYVRNITDVEDKIIDRAAERGVEIDELTRTTTEWFHEDMAALGVDYRDDPGFKEPHATDFIPEMVGDDRARLIAGAMPMRPRGMSCSTCIPTRNTGAFGPVGGGHDRGRAGRGGALQARPDGFRAVETVERRPARMGQPLGTGAPRLAYRVLGHEPRAVGRKLRHPRRRDRPAVSAPRERDRAILLRPSRGRVCAIWMHNEMLVRSRGTRRCPQVAGQFLHRAGSTVLDQGVPGEVIRFVAHAVNDALFEADGLDGEEEAGGGGDGENATPPNSRPSDGQALDRRLRLDSRSTGAFGLIPVGVCP